MKVILRYLVLPLAVVTGAAILLVWAVKLFPVYAWSILGILLAGALISGVKHVRSERLAGWRFKHLGRDQVCYEELRNGRWERILLDGERQMAGDVHHIIYLDNAVFPDWAATRREEIIARVKTKCQPPDYAYE